MIFWIILGTIGWMAILIATVSLLMAAARADRALEDHARARRRREAMRRVK